MLRLRSEMWEKNPVCFMCKNTIVEYIDCTLEHVVPRSLGGRNHKRNLSISHRACNHKRQNVRCKLVLETLGIWKEPTLKKTYIKKGIAHKLVAETDNDFERLVDAWRIKLRQQYLDEFGRKKVNPPMQPEDKFKSLVRAWKVKLRQRYEIDTEKGKIIFVGKFFD